MSVNHFYSLYTNNVSGIPSDIIGYIETSYDKLLLELYYTYRTEAVSVITAHKNWKIIYVSSSYTNINFSRQPLLHFK